MKLMKQLFPGAMVGQNDRVAAERRELTESMSDARILANIRAAMGLSNLANSSPAGSSITVPVEFLEAATDYYLMALIAECERRDLAAEGGAA